jgi:hypothetical protein
VLSSWQGDGPPFFFWTKQIYLWREEVPRIWREINWFRVCILTVLDESTNDSGSVFLQSLEFYQGTLFLTTNRVETFDEAFESRVHIAIKYDELSAASRREVWKTFLGVQARQGQLPNEGQKSVGEREADITEEDIEDFVKEGLNGRQIKNVVKSADLLARSDKGPLRAEHVRVVLRIKKMEKDGRWATKT